jgi:hypothetical protein
MLDLRPPAQRLGYDRAPAQAANRARNLLGGRARAERWQTAHDEVWHLIEPLLIDGGSRVAIVGAGNGDDLPLQRLASRASAVVLIDVDPRAPRRARRRLPRAARRRVATITHDITDGAADAVTLAARRERDRDAELPALGRSPLPGSPYDLVIGDLFYSQLLYPGLLDSGVAPARRAGALHRLSPRLVEAVVTRLHASTTGAVLHLHDPLGWWNGHDQAMTPVALVDLARRDEAAALRAVAHGNGPHESDPRRALGALGIPVRETRMWLWPFAEGVDYLVCATLAGRVGGPHPGRGLHPPA